MFQLKFAATLTALGVDSIEELATLSEDDLIEAGIPKPKARILLQAAVQVRGLALTEIGLVSWWVASDGDQCVLWMHGHSRFRPRWYQALPRPLWLSLLFFLRHIHLRPLNLHTRRLRLLLVEMARSFPQRQQRSNR